MALRESSRAQASKKQQTEPTEESQNPDVMEDDSDAELVIRTSKRKLGVHGAGERIRFRHRYIVFRIATIEDVGNMVEIQAAKPSKGAVWEFVLPIFDVTKGNITPLRLSLSHNKINTAAQLPGLPDNLIMGGIYKQPYEEFVNERAVGDDKDKIESVLHIITYMAYKYSYYKTTSEDIKALWKCLCADWGVEQGNQKPGVYGGYRLCEFKRQWKGLSTLIRPSTIVYDDHKGMLPVRNISIKSLDQDDINTVMSEVDRVYVETGGDLKKALIASHRLNFQLHQLFLVGNLPFVEVCNCEDPATSELLHPCDSCKRYVPCKDLVFAVNGRRLDSRCVLRQPVFGKVGALHQFNRVAAAELRKRQRMKPYILDDRPPVKALFNKTIHPTCYVDQLCPSQEYPDGIHRPHVGTSVGKKASPLNFSLDAAFPVAWIESLPLDEVKTFTHFSFNLVTTFLAANYGKYMWLLGWLHEWASYEHQRQELKDQVTQEMVKDIVHKADGVHAAALHTGYKLRKRGDNLDRLQRQWVQNLFQKGSYRTDGPSL